MSKYKSKLIILEIIILVYPYLNKTTENQLW